MRRPWILLTPLLALAAFGGCGPGLTPVKLQPLSHFELVNVECIDLENGTATLRAFLDAGPYRLDDVRQVTLSLEGMPAHDPQSTEFRQISNAGVDVLVLATGGGAATMKPEEYAGLGFNAELLIDTPQGYVDASRSRGARERRQAAWDSDEGGWDRLDHLRALLEHRNSDAPSQLLVLHVGRDVRVTDEYVSGLAQELRKAQHTWAVIYVEGRLDCRDCLTGLAQSNDVGRRLFYVGKTESPEQQKETIRRAHRLLSSSLFEIRFRIPTVDDVTQAHYDLVCESSIGGRRQRSSKGFEVDVAAVRQKRALETMQEILATVKYRPDDCLPALGRLLILYSDTGREEVFKSGCGEYRDCLEAALVLTPTGESLQHADDLLSMGATWRAEHEAWYRDARVRYLRLLARHETETGAPRQELIDTYEMLSSLDPDDVDARFEIHRLRGDEYQAGGDFDDAVAEYSAALLIRDDPGLRDRMRSMVRDLIKSRYRGHAFADVCAIAARHEGLIVGHFESRYYWFDSAVQSGNNADASRQFEWLMLNWESDSPYAWDDVLLRLIAVYTRDLDYAGAYGVLKRIATEGTAQADVNPQLPYHLLRAQYLAPFVRAVSLVADGASQERQQALVGALSFADVPKYIEAVCVTDASWNTKLVLRGTPGVLPPEAGSDQLTEFIEGQKSGWIICRGQRSRVVLQTRGGVDAPDASLLEDCMTPNPATGKVDGAAWMTLETRIHGRLKKDAAMLLARVIGTEYALGGAGALATFERAVRALPGYQYLVVHDKDGDPVYTRDFDARKPNYQPQQWEQSRTTPLYMSIATTLENGTAVDDLSYAITLAGPKGEKHGVVRFGVTR